MRRHTWVPLVLLPALACSMPGISGAIESLSDFTTGVGDLAYSADGSLLFAAASDGMLRVYSTSDYLPVLTAMAPAGIMDLALSADGRFIATGGSGRIDLWRIAR
jgi:WD40 repeat protein